MTVTPRLDPTVITRLHLSPTRYVSYTLRKTTVTVLRMATAVPRPAQT